MMRLPMRSHVVVCTVLLLAAAWCLPAEAVAQRVETPSPEWLMERMTGTWVMTGTIDHQQVTHDVVVDRILHKQYVRIHELAREKDAAGEPAYEAWIHVAWDKAKREFVVMWLDNTGVTNFAAEGVGHGTPEGDRIPFVWRLADGSGLRNTFAYERASDTWTWAIDNVDTAGKVSVFARVALTRRSLRPE